MQEAFIHYVWQFQQFNHQSLRTTNGESLVIFNPGHPHQDEGPDFRNARLRIGKTLWAGNVELHVRASDWQAHQHEGDPHYESVILHVVHEADVPIRRQNGELIPTLALKGRIAPKLAARYQWIQSSRHWIPCLERFQEVELFRKQVFMQRLLIERFEYRSTYFQEVFTYYRQDWSQSFYHVLAAGFGIPINQLPFEMLARSLPLNLLRKHASSAFQIEALIFGQAGMLKQPPLDHYQASLQSEYHHLVRKFGLHPIDGSIWHYLRLRPASFPSARLAQFAALITSEAHLFSKVRQHLDKKALFEILRPTVSIYWQNHYRFGKLSKKVPVQAGKAFVERLIANTIVPFLFFYQQTTGKNDAPDALFALISSCKGEKNKILHHWERLGMPNNNAFDSQSLLHWKKHYCDQRKCLNCVVGKALFEQRTEKIE
ncbi:MAG: DUF2851 family protein [Bacteroidota bacterium]